MQDEMRRGAAPGSPSSRARSTRGLRVCNGHAAVPTATASASTPVSATKRPASSGSVNCSSSSVGLDEIGGADPAELGLDRDAARVGVGDDRARDAHVVIKRRRRLVDHHRGEAGGDRRLDHRHLEGVVEMEHHRNRRGFRLERGAEGVAERRRGDAVALELALRDLHDRGRARALGGAQRSAGSCRVARRERAERVAAGRSAAASAALRVTRFFGAGGRDMADLLGALTSEGAARSAPDRERRAAARPPRAAG